MVLLITTSSTPVPAISNQQFDQWLKTRDPESSIRNFEDLNDLAEKAGMNLINDYEMPANNRILHWKK